LVTLMCPTRQPMKRLMTFFDAKLEASQERRIVGL
jgi:hypothetical protein